MERIRAHKSAGPEVRRSNLHSTRTPIRAGSAELSLGSVLHLQRSAGNRAVVALMHGKPVAAVSLQRTVMAAAEFDTGGAGGRHL